MNTLMKTDIWIYYLVIVLGLTTVTCAIATIILMVVGLPLSGIFITLGFVAIAGLSRLLISPLNKGLLK